MEEFHVGDRVKIYPAKVGHYYGDPIFGIVIKVFKHLCKIQVVPYDMVETLQCPQFPKWYKPRWDESVYVQNYAKKYIIRYPETNWNSAKINDVDGKSMKELTVAYVSSNYD